MATKKEKKNIANTKSNKEMQTKYERKADKEETDKEDGEALSIKPKKKSKLTGVVGGGIGCIIQLAIWGICIIVAIKLGLLVLSLF